MGYQARRIKDVFLPLISTRRRRIILVGAALLLVALILDFGLFTRELDYQVAQLGSTLTASEPQLLPPVEQDTPLQNDEIRIKTIGARAPIVYVDRIDNDLFVDALRRGVVHYPLTALPGLPGNVFIFGHSSDWIGVESPYRNVFALLPHLNIGDEIEVSDSEGTVFVYVVVDTFIVSPTDTRVLDQGDGTQSLLTIQTSYPFGTALARFIVRATLKP